MRVLFFGDIVGKGGRKAVASILPKLRKKHKPDLVVANGENLAHGKGVTLKTFEELLNVGVDFFTSGNHVFDKPEIVQVFEKYPDKIIRPSNFQGKLTDGSDLPGAGFAVIDVKGVPVLMINLNGQVFMEKQFDFGQVTNPFLELNKILSEHGGKAVIKIVDFHAEATSEKRGMGIWCDGRVSALIGSHTHVQTADAQILPQGTGYLTDVGMVGAADSVIGTKSEGAIKRLMADPASPTKIPLEVDEGDKFEIGYVVLEIDSQTSKCQNIDSQLIWIK
ncbi:MAG: TIGR00282 family metallophosphoesterase [bacterium]|nr:TIGR00282 family metallophosphoesterase [bacterium]